MTIRSHFDSDKISKSFRNLNSLNVIQLIKEKEEVSLKLKELGVDEELINLKGMTQGMLVILGQKNIKKLTDFADLSSDELIGGFDEIKSGRRRNHMEPHRNRTT